MYTLHGNGYFIALKGVFMQGGFVINVFPTTIMNDVFGDEFSTMDTRKKGYRVVE